MFWNRICPSTRMCEYRKRRLQPSCGSAVALVLEQMRAPYASGRYICEQKFRNAYKRKEIAKRMPHFKSTFNTKSIKRFSDWNKMLFANDVRFPFTYLRMFRGCLRHVLFVTCWDRYRSFCVRCTQRSHDSACSYNPGQNVWDKVTFSRIAAPMQCWTTHRQAFPYEQHCMGGGGEGRIWPKESLFPCEKLIDGRGSAFCKLVPHNFGQDCRLLCV